MAINALQSAASGMSALNTQLDVISNNLANVNTPGFKASRANFQDLLYVQRSQPGTRNEIGDTRPIGTFVGLGVKVAGTQQNFKQGAFINTDRELDVAIQGAGFFQVQMPDNVPGSVGFTRSGSLALNQDNELVLANDQGRRLQPPVTLPANATSVSIDSDGQVFVSIPGDQTPQLVGQINISVFVNPAGLEPLGENIWAQSEASGPPQEGTPNSDNRGQLLQNFLENSNVDPTEELINLIRTQRAFEMNSNTIRAADEALRTASNLRR
ncbi:MAG: flagellar basal-body rod protein FlgG [Planctomycetaceae bacterium]|jgi:flagellar basal-body rod protein FlgG|nr:flagellar basal-body rod protein FlgG [Phycisphaerales bacterium]MCE2653700.1 flagellar basal-body rod protein FlgG [Planctomycetaceae bacterium]